MVKRQRTDDEIREAVRHRILELASMIVGDIEGETEYANPDGDWLNEDYGRLPARRSREIAYEEREVAVAAIRAAWRDPEAHHEETP